MESWWLRRLSTQFVTFLTYSFLCFFSVIVFDSVSRTVVAGEDMSFFIIKKTSRWQCTASNDEIVRRCVAGDARDSTTGNILIKLRLHLMGKTTVLSEKLEAKRHSWCWRPLAVSSPRRLGERRRKQSLMIWNLTRKGTLSTVRHGKLKDGVILCNRSDAVEWLQGETQAVEDESGWQFLENWLRSKKVAAQVPVVGRDSKSWLHIWYPSGKVTPELMRWGVFIVNVGCYSAEQRNT